MNKEYETNGKALFDGELIKTKRDNIKELIAWKTVDFTNHHAPALITWLNRADYWSIR